MSNSQDEKVKDASFQEQVAPWVQACFGAEIASNVRERNHRFIEESLELVQAQGLSLIHISEPTRPY